MLIFLGPSCRKFSEINLLSVVGWDTAPFTGLFEWNRPLHEVSLFYWGAQTACLPRILTSKWESKNLGGNAGGLLTWNHQLEGGYHLWYLVWAIESRWTAKLECLVFGFERYPHQMCIAHRNVSTSIAFLAHFWLHFFSIVCLGWKGP